MESLALLAAVVVATASIGGPLSLLISYLYQRYRKSRQTLNRTVRFVYIALTVLLAVPAILVGLRLVTLDLGFGGILFGFTGIITGAMAIRKLFNQKY